MLPQKSLEHHHLELHVHIWYFSSSGGEQNWKSCRGDQKHQNLLKRKT